GQGDQEPSEGEEEGNQDPEPEQGDQGPSKGQEESQDPKPEQNESDQGLNGGQVDKPEAENNTTISSDDPALVAPGLEKNGQTANEQAIPSQEEEEQIVS
ncbi:hypothetical protein, partial [Aerococcus urinae]